MLFTYNVFLTLVALLLLPLVGAVVLVRPRYRCGLKQRLGFLPWALRNTLAGSSPFWLHAPSVGEVMATRPFLQGLKQRCPGRKVLVSVLTPTGYEAARARVPEADAVIYFPLDHPLIIRRVLDAVRPQAFFFTETEIWPNFLSTAARREIPTFLVSGRVSAHTLRRFQFFFPRFRRVLDQVALFCMQFEPDARRLRQTGIPLEKVVVTGNFKVDQVREGEETGRRILQVAGLSGRSLFIAASTHRGEEAIVLQVYRRLRTRVPDLLLLLAPRYPQRFTEVEELLRKKGSTYLKRSQMNGTKLEQRVETERREQCLSDSSVSISIEVFLLDTLGELASFYSAARLAFVGGSMVDHGGQSAVEPALAAIPVLFGPYTRNFASLAEELKQEGGAREVRDEESLYQEALRVLTNDQVAQEMGRKAQVVIQRNQGAVARTLEAVFTYFPGGGTWCS